MFIDIGPNPSQCASRRRARI